MADVFLVDDHPDVREVVGQLLKMHGHTVHFIASGEEALEKMAVHLPEVVVTDHRLSAMSGVQLLQIIRADPKYKDVHCVLFSADENTRELAAEAGAHTFWLKGSDSMFDSIAQLQSLVEQSKAGI